ncbi:MAG: hydrogenase maturation nickel metallochaperone HypA [bacterium]
MHEYSITQALFRAIERSLPLEIPPELIREVYVEIGALDAVVPETLEFIFNALKERQGMAEARLFWKIIPIRAQCELCEEEFSVDEPYFLCPHCGEGMVKILSGRGIILTRIVIAEAENDALSSVNQGK